MIRNLSMQSFKRFVNESLQFKPLTILAGKNGAGKTSTIHALMLLRSAVMRSDGIAELNGSEQLSLGWFEELVNFEAPETSFTISIDVGDDDQRVTGRFTAGDTELYAAAEISGPGETVFPRDHLRAFQYISAERNGPQLTQRASTLPLNKLTAGSRGEFIANVLDKLGSQSVHSAMIDTSNADSLPLVKAQTESWLSRIVRPIELDTISLPNTDVVSLVFRAPGSEWIRPTNMGFGLSYTLPVILSALTACRESVLVVENPEAHLHPAGQSEMGVFLAQAAGSGIQVIVETHSDHLINGMRRAIGELQLLPAQESIVHFFSDEEEAVLPLSFTDVGGITKWPRGFFDQYQFDVSRISRIRRRR